MVPPFLAPPVAWPLGFFVLALLPHAVTAKAATVTRAPSAIADLL